MITRHPLSIEPTAKPSTPENHEGKEINRKRLENDMKKE